MPAFAEATDLVEVGPDVSGRNAQLIPAAASAWFALRDAAAHAGVTLQLVSAFRSIARQTEIVTAKLQRGQPLEDILRFSAYPGHSEHHTGRAIDLTTPGCPLLTAAFADTAAYSWLHYNAHRHGFRLSYPPDSPTGIAFEPWHWCWRAPRSESEGR